MITLKRILPRAPFYGVLARFFNRREAGCFVLGKGFRVSGPRCAICAADLDLPYRGSETFLLAAPMLEPKTDSSAAPANNWLFFGTKVLVAMVSSRLAALLERSVAFFGERILVAMAKRRGDAREPILFCKSCAANLLARVSPASAQYYAWDWLAELEPRGPEAGWQVRQKLAKVRRYLPIHG